MAQLRAFITGVTGQDGSHLTDLLLQKGYEVHGFARRGSRVDERVRVHYGDLSDPATLHQALHEAEAHEVYNLGAQSHVHASFREPEYTFRVTAEPIITILNHVRNCAPNTRVYQASSSEMFGLELPPQHESTPFAPQSPYAIAKVAAHQTVSLYRRAYGIFSVSGILFNHEGERRPPSFVTRKISRGVARIALGLDKEIVLGNLDARRDWGYAPDYVAAMWRMLQQDDPRDYVIATGETFSVRDFVVMAFRFAEDATGKLFDWEKHVRIDATFKRPAEVPDLCGDATRALADLGWQPTVRFHELVRRMVMNDFEQLKATQTIR
jgi:GDPmannose 4,6-dehydratase